MIATPTFPSLASKAPGCSDFRIEVCKGSAFAHAGILSWRNDGHGVVLHHCGMHSLRVIGTVTCDAQQWLVLRQLCQQLRHQGRIADVVGGDADGSHLQCLGIDTDVQLAPLMSTFRAMLFALPFAFAQELAHNLPNSP